MHAFYPWSKGLSGLKYKVSVLQDVCLVSTALWQLGKHQIRLTLACIMSPPSEPAAQTPEAYPVQSGGLTAVHAQSSCCTASNCIM